MSNLLLCLLFITSSGLNFSTKEEKIVSCDLMEINHKYHQKSGKKDYIQIIFYKWCPEIKHDVVMDWKRFNEKDSWPRRAGNRYIFYKDGRKGEVLIYYSNLFIETHTFHDRERDNKNIFPEKYRVELLR